MFKKNFFVIMKIILLITSIVCVDSYDENNNQNIKNIDIFL